MPVYVIVFLLLSLIAAIMAAWARELTAGVILFALSALFRSAVVLGLATPEVALVQIIFEIMLFTIYICACGRQAHQRYISAPRSASAAGALALLFVLIVSGLHGIEHIPAEQKAPATADESPAQNKTMRVLLDDRAFDTLGVLCVIAAASAGVATILRKRRDADPEPPSMSPGLGTPIMVAARWIVPLALIVGIYNVAASIREPGGAFAGGALVAAALIASLIASGRQGFAGSAAPVLLLFASAGIFLFLLVGAGGILASKEFLTNFLVSQDKIGTLPYIALAVFLTIAAGMAALVISLTMFKSHSAGLSEDQPADTRSK